MHSKTATYQVSYFLSKLLFQSLCSLRALTFSKQLYYSFTRATFPKVAVFQNSWFSVGNLEEFFGPERYWLAADERYYLKITVPAIKKYQTARQYVSFIWLNTTILTAAQHQEIGKNASLKSELNYLVTN